MFKDKIIRIKLIKFNQQTRPLSFVGKCLSFNDSWVAIQGRGIMVARINPRGVQIDDKLSQHVIPRSSIESIRVLPDDFDVNDLTISTEGQQLVFPVRGQQPCFVGEIGEG